LKISSSHVSAWFLDKLNDLPDFELLVGVDINGMYDPAFSIDGRKEEENLFPETPGTRRSVMPLYVDYDLLDDQLTKSVKVKRRVPTPQPVWVWNKLLVTPSYRFATDPVPVTCASMLSAPYVILE
jgi:hypothetical protein